MNYEERMTSIPIRDDKFLDRDEDESEIGSKTKFLDQMWPTEKYTTYHLGGTRYWELDIMEPSVVFSITTKSKAIDVPVTEPSTVFSITTSFTTKSKATDIPVTEPSVVFTTDFTTKSKAVDVTRTTCLYVVLKNEINTDTKTKRNIHYHKRNVYNNETRKYNISIKKQKIGLKNITRKNMQNLRASNRYEQRSGRKRKLFKFSRFSNENSIIAKTRKLCSVNGNESKHQIIKHKDTKNKTKKKQSTKSQKLQNINSRSPKSCTNNCITNKKNSGKTITTTTANHSQAKNSNKENNKKVTNTDNHKNLSICMSRNRKNHNLNCICDIVNVIENIKSILNRISFSLDEIKTLNCSVYKETQDKIVISMDSDAEEAREFSQPHYNTESLKGQKYIKLEELEDDFKSDLEPGNGISLYNFLLNAKILIKNIKSTDVMLQKNFIHFRSRYYFIARS